MSEINNKFLYYKGFPVVKCKNTIYYGNMFDEHVVVMQIIQTEKTDDMQIAKKIKVFKMLTDQSLPADKQIVKSAEKTSLAEALDIASYWLSKH